MGIASSLLMMHIDTIPGLGANLTSLGKTASGDLAGPFAQLLDALGVGVSATPDAATLPSERLQANTGEWAASAPLDGEGHSASGEVELFAFAAVEQQDEGDRPHLSGSSITNPQSASSATAEHVGAKRPGDHGHLLLSLQEIEPTDDGSTNLLGKRIYENEATGDVFELSAAAQPVPRTKSDGERSAASQTERLVAASELNSVSSARPKSDGLPIDLLDADHAAAEDRVVASNGDFSLEEQAPEPANNATLQSQLASIVARPVQQSASSRVEPIDRASPDEGLSGTLRTEPQARPDGQPSAGPTARDKMDMPNFRRGNEPSHLVDKDSGPDFELTQERRSELLPRAAHNAQFAEPLDSIGGVRQTFHAALNPQNHNVTPNLQSAVAIQIAQSLDGATDRFEIQLTPEELGKVEIAMEFDGERRAQMTIIVERNETFELLSRDQRQLERILTAQGLQIEGGIDLSLRQDQSRDRPSHHDYPSANDGEAELRDVEVASDAPALQPLFAGNGLFDMVI